MQKKKHVWSFNRVVKDRKMWVIPYKQQITSQDQWGLFLHDSCSQERYARSQEHGISRITQIDFTSYVLVATTQALNHLASSKKELTAAGVVWVCRPVREATVCLKTTMAAPKAVDLATISSVIPELEKYFSAFLPFSRLTSVKVWFTNGLCWW